MVRLQLPNLGTPPAGTTAPRRTALRNGLLLALSLTLGSTLLLACSLPGRDSDKKPEIVVQTFTPVPPDYTPPAQLTRDARGTEWALTATVEADQTPTAPSAQGTRAPVEATESPRPGEIRPPTVVLRTAGGDQIGSVGSFNYVDPTTEHGAKIDAPYVPLNSTFVPWPADTPGTVEVPDSPYAVRAATINVYTYETNVARPTSTQGVPTGEIAFYPRTPPAQTLELTGAAIEITLDVPPGNYVIDVKIHWAAPANAQGEQATQYVFIAEAQ